jgi:hypothetical protein
MKVHDYGRMRVGNHYVGAWAWDSREGDTFKRLRGSYDAVLQTASGFVKKRDEVTKDARLTAQGQAEELEKWFRQSGLSSIAQAERVILPAAKRDAESRRANLTAAAPDKTDLAGAIMRQELRAHIRELSAQKRTALLNDPDPVVALAVTEAPAMLSGVTPATHKRLTDKAIEALHPGELETVVELEKAIETLERAVKATGAEIRGELSVPPAAFAKMLEGVKDPKAEAPKLQRYGDEIRVLTENGKGELIARKATAEEIQLGQFVGSA